MARQLLDTAYTVDVHKHNARALAMAARAQFVAACAYDGMAADTQFAVFSDHNPHASEYDKAMREYLDYRRLHSV